MLSIEELKSKKVLIVYPHPDDDTYTLGGFLQLMNENNVDFKVITLTKGGAGKSFVDLTNTNISAVRTGEYFDAIREMSLRPNKFLLLDYTDSKLRESKDEISKYLEDFITNDKTDIVITYDNSGMTGHPDHIVISQILFEISKKKKLDLYYFALDGFLRFMNRTTKTAKNFQDATDSIYIPFRLRWNQYHALISHKSQFGILKYKIAFLTFLFHSSVNFHKVDFSKNYNFDFVPFDI